MPVSMDLRLSCPRPPRGMIIFHDTNAQNQVGTLTLCATNPVARHMSASVKAKRSKRSERGEVRGRQEVQGDD